MDLLNVLVARCIIGLIFLVVTTEVTVETTTETSTSTKTSPAPIAEATNGSQTDEEVQEQSSDKAAAEQPSDAVHITQEGEESKSPGGTKTNFFDKLFHKKSDTKPVEVDVEIQSKEITLPYLDQVDAEEVTSDLKSVSNF